MIVITAVALKISERKRNENEMGVKYIAQNIIEYKLKGKKRFSVSARRLLSLFLSFLAGIFLIFLDFLLKEIKLHDSSSVIVKNSGITWGVGSEYAVDDINRYIPFVIAIGIFMIFYTLQTFHIYKKMNKKQRYFWTLGGLLVLAGGVANLIDRIRLGYIIDYILIWRFPPLNLADLYIFIGICWLAALVILSERRLRNVVKI